MELVWKEKKYRWDRFK